MNKAKTAASISPTTARRTTTNKRFRLTKMGEDFTQAVQDQRSAMELQQASGHNIHRQKSLNATRTRRGLNMSSMIIGNEELNSPHRRSPTFGSPYRAKSTLADISMPGSALADSIKKQK